MARKGNSRHINTLAAPIYFGVHRKESKYVTKANPGRFNSENSIPISLVLKKVEAADIMKNIKHIIKSNIVTVNNKPINDERFPVGFGDIVEIKGKGAFKIGIDMHGRASFEAVEKPDYNNMIYKAIGKYKTKKANIIIKLHNGSIINGDNNIKVNDSVIVDESNKIKSILPLKTGAKCYIISGVHVGIEGIIKEVKPGSIKMKPSVTIETKEGKSFGTLVRNIIVTG
ncbi:MAG: hypothetical protein M1538_02160 [Candidatus Marsarchaeota archaeon]|jgi:small subunit ribosomal protein S4e|nr:hypothetical protein [Candidatus Marsarchaeota archaeon]